VFLRVTILSDSRLQGALLHGAGGFDAGIFYAPMKKAIDYGNDLAGA